MLSNDPWYLFISGGGAGNEISSVYFCSCSITNNFSEHNIPLCTVTASFTWKSLHFDINIKSYLCPSVYVWTYVSVHQWRTTSTLSLEIDYRVMQCEHDMPRLPSASFLYHRQWSRKEKEIYLKAIWSWPSNLEQMKCWFMASKKIMSVPAQMPLIVLLFKVRITFSNLLACILRTSWSNSLYAFSRKRTK